MYAGAGFVTTQVRQQHFYRCHSTNGRTQNYDRY